MADTATKQTTPQKPQRNGPEVTSVTVGPNKLTENGGKVVSALDKARAARKPADPNESKSDKFRRLANMRVPRVIKSLAAVESLANRSAYERTDEQSEKILQAIEEAVKSLRRRFQGAPQAKTGWSL